MRAAMARREMFRISFLPFFLLLAGLAASTTATATTERRAADDGKPGGSTSLFLLTGYKPPVASIPRPPTRPAKEAEVHAENGDDELPAANGGPAVAAETPPKPLAQRGSNVSAADALKPPLGAAKVAPAPRQLVDTDSCRGYFDVMGQFDSPFNCSKDTYIYCCGTCHYRFCCEHPRSRLDQSSCTNYISPVWANTQQTATVATGNKQDPDFETLLQQSSSTTYVIGGVISFTLVLAVGVRIAFSKVSRRPRNRDINMPRALVDILRHQSSPVQPGGVRNNSTILTTSSTTAPDGRTSKNLYAPAMQSKDNRSIGNLQHPFKQQGAGSSPKHSATIERAPPRIMNNSQLPAAVSAALGGGGGTLPSAKHNNAIFTSTSFSSSLSRPVPHGAHHSHLYHQGQQQQRQPSSHSFSHSFHNLAQLPPSYESAVKPDISRYCSLKRLEKELDDYTGYYTSSKRRGGNNAPPSFHSSQHHLQYGGGGGGDYTLGARGTLPLHGSRPRIHIPSTPNPYPLPPQQQQQQQPPQAAPYASAAFDRPPRRVRSQDELLAFGEGNTLSRLQAKNQQHQYYKATMSTSKTAQTLRRSQERLLVSPDRLEDRLMAMGLLVGAGGDRRVNGGGGGGGGVPTMGRLSHNHKAQSQQNICATTPSLDRHHMIKMNSHPTSGHEHEQSTPPRGWDPHGGRGHMGGGGGGGGGGHPNARRMAFATKRQNTIEQLHFIPGGGGGGGGGGQGLRTGSKNEVTV